jgi:glycosyltransferase involved in cell wall biosynthesis
VRPSAKVLLAPVARAGAVQRHKTFSAMIRVRNEEEYLEPCIRSIVELVEEIVVVDNMSDDRSPAIVADLQHEFPGKIRSYEYPHRIARVGSENVELYESKGGKDSPSLLANYYNFCVSKCTQSFILKWDGDTIATARLGTVLDEFRDSPSQVLWHQGANLHEFRDCLIAGHPYEDMEPRLYARRFATYTNGMYYCEALRSPYLDLFPQYSERCPDVLYVHMKYCKKDLFSNLSDDCRQVAEGWKTPGPPIDDLIRETLERWV